MSGGTGQWWDGGGGCPVLGGCGAAGRWVWGDRGVAAASSPFLKPIPSTVVGLWRVLVLAQSGDSSE